MNKITTIAFERTMWVIVSLSLILSLIFNLWLRIRLLDNSTILDIVLSTLPSAFFVISGSFFCHLFNAQNTELKFLNCTIGFASGNAIHELLQIYSPGGGHMNDLMGVMFGVFFSWALFRFVNGSNHTVW